MAPHQGEVDLTVTMKEPYCQIKNALEEELTILPSDFVVLSV